MAGDNSGAGLPTGSLTPAQAVQIAIASGHGPGKSALVTWVILWANATDLDIRGISGDQKLETFSGDISVEGAKGAMELKTFSGRIDVNLTGAGAAPSLSAETFSGRIQARLAENARGEISFDSFSGEFNSEIPLTVRSVGRRRTSGSLPGGSDGSTLRFHTFSGDVKVTK